MTKLLLLPRLLFSECQAIYSIVDMDIAEKSLRNFQFSHNIQDKKNCVTKLIFKFREKCRQFLRS